LNGRGLLIHQSGDEFDLILPFKNYIEIIEILHSCYKSVKNHMFCDANDIDLTMAIGVWIANPEDKDDYLSMRDKAENTYHPKEKNGTKQRNSIRVDKKENFISLGEGNAEVGLLRVLGNAYTKDLFHNAFLDYISCIVSNIYDFGSLQTEINDYLSWISPQYDNKLRSTVLCDKWDTKEQLSYIDIGLSALQGILINEKSKGKKISFKVESNQVCIAINDECVLAYQDNSITGNVYWEQENYVGLSPNSETRKTILVLGGYTTTIRLPEDMFYRIVRVDERPFIGGGLPDLWAATLSELVNCMKNNSELTDIVIFGELDNIKSVSTFLDNVSQWDTEQLKYISKKTYKSYGDILDFKERFSGHISVLKSENDLLKHVFVTNKDINRATEKLINIHNGDNKRFLQRKLPYDRLQLKITDGCRTDTIAHAFPIVLEILRDKLEEGKEITDQAGRKLLELTNFKILLETPRIEKLPEYYCFDEKMMDNYYDSVLGEDDGLFRKRLNKNNQIDEMIKHVVSAIGGKNLYATRRAILVVQNEIQSTDNYSPLGLVAIWLSPRFDENKVVIDYTYTWRTVEAIVGLPLSLYASVKFAEQLTEMISTQSKNSKHEVKMGHVSYIAHSLHMFTDEECLNIVRGIVNEVSI
jgi:hypothetical protein